MESEPVHSLHFNIYRHEYPVDILYDLNILIFARPVRLFKEA